MKEYQNRNKILHNIGFNSYQEYLQSDLWKQIRKKIYVKFNGKCFVCNTKGSDIHHLKYSLEILLGDILEEMVVLCRSCHQTIEFSDNGKIKLTQENANKKMYALREGKYKNTNHEPVPNIKKPIIKEISIKRLPNGIKRVPIKENRLKVGDIVECVNGDMGMIREITDSKKPRFRICDHWHKRAKVLYFIQGDNIQLSRVNFAVFFIQKVFK